MAVEQIRLAMLRDEVAFEDLGTRFKAVHAARTTEELAAVVADLSPLEPATPAMSPTPAPLPLRQPISPTAFSLFGDLKKGGEVAVGGNVSYVALFGNVVCDLSAATIPEATRITVVSLFGNTTVILPDGVRASIESVTLLGSQKDKLVAPYLDAPSIRVSSWSLFGDARVYSLSLLPEGKLRKLWRALRSA